MSKDEDLISIIIPVYNAEKYLEKCIDSIIKQTYSSLEIILINDGSKDRSLDICYKYANDDKRIVVIDKKNEGVSIARNKGIEIATGKWISFIDADDWIELDMYENMIRKSKNSELDIVICNCYINKGENEDKNDFLSNKDRIYNKDEITIFQQKFLCKGIKEYKPYVWGIGAPWCKLYRSKLLKENNIRFIPGLTRNEDGLFNLYALEYARKLLYIPQCLYHYRVLSDSLSHGKQLNIIENTEKNLNELIKFAEKFNKDKIFINGVYSRIITSTQQYLQYLFFYDINILEYNKKKKELLKLMREDIYFNACKKFEYKTMAFTEKIYCFCFKHKLIFSLFLLVKIREFIKR